MAEKIYYSYKEKRKQIKRPWPGFFKKELNYAFYPVFIFFYVFLIATLFVNSGEGFKSLCITLSIGLLMIMIAMMADDYTLRHSLKCFHSAEDRKMMLAVKDILSECNVTIRDGKDMNCFSDLMISYGMSKNIFSAMKKSISLITIVIWIPFLEVCFSHVADYTNGMKTLWKLMMILTPIVFIMAVIFSYFMPDYKIGKANICEEIISYTREAYLENLLIQRDEERSEDDNK